MINLLEKNWVNQFDMVQYHAVGPWPYTMYFSSKTKWLKGAEEIPPLVIQLM